MKRLSLLIILSLVLLTGCHKEELRPIGLKATLESVSGSRARFTVAAENQRVYYSYIVMCEDDSNFNVPEVELCEKKIEFLEEAYTYFNEGDFMDIFFYRGSRQIHLGALFSDKDYKIVFYQVHPKSHKLIGHPIVCEFHTKYVPERDLHFQVDFNREVLNITPSNDDFSFIWQCEESDLIRYNYGGPTSYLYSMVGMYQEYGFLDMYCNKGQSVWDFSMDNHKKDETEYTIVINGCEEGEFTTQSTIVRFIYHPGYIEILDITERDEW